MSETTVRPARRPAKPGGKRTANRFAKLAGGDANPESDLSPAVDDDPNASDGLIAGMSAVAVDEAHHVVEIAVSEIAPHPFNHNSRSQPQPGMKPFCQSRNAAKAFCQTACSFEKNYRLQDIQLSKSRRRLCGASVNPLSYRACSHPQAQRDSKLLSVLALRPPPRFALWWTPSSARCEGWLAIRSPRSGRRMVENTGLEPVTSWLQTRRSPS